MIILSSLTSSCCNRICHHRDLFSDSRTTIAHITADHGSRYPKSHANRQTDWMTGGRAVIPQPSRLVYLEGHGHTVCRLPWPQRAAASSVRTISSSYRTAANERPFCCGLSQSLLKLGCYIDSMQASDRWFGQPVAALSSETRSQNSSLRCLPVTVSSTTRPHPVQLSAGVTLKCLPMKNPP